ncbi:MAG: hypothetical protein JWS12_209 [Candidatus Saccharibacteria bacterium]|nr:hypothetical protein [Candidatus Saccharibacteria bacterium]
MKWPESLTVVRHGESAYNALKAAKQANPTYQEFLEAYEDRRQDPDRARALAHALLDDETMVLNCGDHDTPLTERGLEQSRKTGKNLSKLIKLPDVIFVSPYDRTNQTLDAMAIGWPELRAVKTVEEERLREQEHGLALLYNDWRIFHVLHPEQEKLYDKNGPYWYRYPQGESVPDVRERNRSWLVTTTRDYHEQNVLAVTHHLLKLSLRANLERLGADEFQRLDQEEKPINGGVTIYRGHPELGRDNEGKLLLDLYNEKLY